MFLHKDDQQDRCTKLHQSGKSIFDLRSNNWFKKKIRWPRRKNFTSWNNWNVEIFTRTLIGPNPGSDILKERIKQKIESVHSSRSSDWDQRECSRKMKGGIDLRRKISAYHRYLFQIKKKDKKYYEISTIHDFFEKLSKIIDCNIWMICLELNWFL